MIATLAHPSASSSQPPGSPRVRPPPLAPLAALLLSLQLVEDGQEEDALDVLRRSNDHHEVRTTPPFLEG